MHDWSLFSGEEGQRCRRRADPPAAQVEHESMVERTSIESHPAWRGDPEVDVWQVLSQRVTRDIPVRLLSLGVLGQDGGDHRPCCAVEVRRLEHELHPPVIVGRIPSQHLVAGRRHKGDCASGDYVTGCRCRRSHNRPLGVVPGGARES